MTGQRRPSVRILKRMSEFFKVTMDEVYGRLEEIREIRERGALWLE